MEQMETWPSQSLGSGVFLVQVQMKSKLVSLCNLNVPRCIEEGGRMLLRPILTRWYKILKISARYQRRGICILTLGCRIGLRVFDRIIGAIICRGEVRG